MPQYDDTNRLVFFENDRKERESQPDFTGNLNVDGVSYWLSVWEKEGPKGKFFSGSIKPKENLREAVAPKQTVTSGPAKYDPLDSDDIPFMMEWR